MTKTTDELIDAIEAYIKPIASADIDKTILDLPKLAKEALPLLAELRERVAALPPQPQEK